MFKCEKSRIIVAGYRNRVKFRSSTRCRLDCAIENDPAEATKSLTEKGIADARRELSRYEALSAEDDLRSCRRRMDYG